MPSRREIEEHVDALRGDAGGREFADAIAAYADGLDERERETLAEVLMGRAGEQGAFDRGLALRLQSRGWFRRQWDKLDPATLRERR